MFDDDVDDMYLLEAVEAIENLQSNNVEQANEKLSCETNYHNILPASTNKFLTTDFKSKTDFRSRLLSTLTNRKNKPGCNAKNEVQKSICNSVKMSDYGATDIASKELKLQLSIDKSLQEPTINVGHDILLYKEITNDSSSVYKIKSIENTSSRFKFSSSEIAFQNKNISNPLTSIIRKRKFPGPAGILPNWADGSSSNSLEDDINLEEKLKKKQFCTEITTCSQNSAEDFWGAWKMMASDFIALLKYNPLDSVNIRWLLRKVTFRGDIFSQKIPFLIVMIHSIDLSHHDATAVFKDETGEMNGIISSTIIDKYSTLISQGAVMVLRDATILSPAGFRMCTSLKEQQRRHYINVTSNSLVCLYSQDDIGEVTKTDIAELKEEELKLLLKKCVRCAESKAVVEESEQDIINEDFDLSLLSNFNSSYIASHNEITIQSSNPKHPLKNSGSSFSSPTLQFQNSAKFSSPNLLNSKSNYRNTPIPKNYCNLSPFMQNKSREQPVQKFSNYNLKRNLISNHKDIPHSNILSNINNVIISKPDDITLTCVNKIDNVSTVIRNTSYTANLKDVPAANNGVATTVISNDYAKSEKCKFKFVNKNVLNNQVQSNRNDDNSTVLPHVSSLIFSDNTKVSNENRNFSCNLANPEEIASNKKLKTDSVDDDDDDDNFDFLLANIDTDSIMKVK